MYKSPYYCDWKNAHKKPRNDLKRKDIANFVKTISNLFSKHKGKINEDKHINSCYKDSAHIHIVNRIQ